MSYFQYATPGVRINLTSLAPQTLETIGLKYYLQEYKLEVAEDQESNEVNTQQAAKRVKKSKKKEEKEQVEKAAEPSKAEKDEALLNNRFRIAEEAEGEDDPVETLEACPVMKIASVTLHQLGNLVSGSKIYSYLTGDTLAAWYDVMSNAYFVDASQDAPIQLMFQFSYMPFFFECHRGSVYMYECKQDSKDAPHFAKSADSEDSEDRPELLTEKVLEYPRLPLAECNKVLTKRWMSSTGSLDGVQQPTRDQIMSAVRTAEGFEYLKLLSLFSSR